MREEKRSPILWGLLALAVLWMMVVTPLTAVAAPYAAMVMDARSGKVLHSRNADTRLHPASLTKMMTLYVVFEAIENGEISLDKKVKISKHAASEPPSKLGLRAGQRIALRYLIRAAAIKSANDAATALAEAIEGSEARFARRMNRTAKAMGMTRTTFKNAHGLTENGHLSTARDMTILGRHVFYDFPQYYNLFSRREAYAGVRSVRHTNRALLNSYRGADGIKTGYTRAAGYNLVASAERGSERMLATVFGGRSTATRNAKVAELLDLGFRRAPSRVAIHKPKRPAYLGRARGGAEQPEPGSVGKVVRLAKAAAVKKSLRPKLRPVDEPVLVAVKEDIEKAILAANDTEQPETEDIIEETLVQAASITAIELPKAPTSSIKPKAKPKQLVLASSPQQSEEPEIVSRLNTSGDRHWSINVGRFASQYKARKVLLQTALTEMTTLDGSKRKVVKKSGGFDANFIGLSQESADLACRRLKAKNINCQTIAPG